MLKKIHYSWFICAGCTLLFFCTGGLGLTGFSAYFPFMTTFNELKQTQISVIIFIRSLFGVFGMLFVNAFLRKFEIRRVVTAAMIVSAVSFLTLLKVYSGIRENLTPAMERSMTRPWKS